MYGLSPRPFNLSASTVFTTVAIGGFVFGDRRALTLHSATIGVGRPDSVVALSLGRAGGL